MAITKKEVLALGDVLFAGMFNNSRQVLQLRARSSASARWVYRRGGRYSDIVHHVVYDVNIYAANLDALADEMKAYAIKRKEGLAQ